MKVVDMEEVRTVHSFEVIAMVVVVTFLLLLFLSFTSGQHGSGVQVSESGGRSGIRQVISRHVNGLIVEKRWMMVDQRGIFVDKDFFSFRDNAQKNFRKPTALPARK